LREKRAKNQNELRSADKSTTYKTGLFSKTR
jgi:hypothetical protein